MLIITLNKFRCYLSKWFNKCAHTVQHTHTRTRTQYTQSLSLSLTHTQTQNSNMHGRLAEALAAVTLGRKRGQITAVTRRREAERKGGKNWQLNRDKERKRELESIWWDISALSPASTSQYGDQSEKQDRKGDKKAKIRARESSVAFGLSAQRREKLCFPDHRENKRNLMTHSFGPCHCLLSPDPAIVSGDNRW